MFMLRRSAMRCCSRVWEPGDWGDLGEAIEACGGVVRGGWGCC